MDYQYDQNETMYRTPPQKKPQGSDAKMWILIAALFVIGLWPIAIVLMIVKLTDRKKPARSTAYNGGQNPTGSRARQSVESMTRTPADSTKSARNMKIGGTVMIVLGGILAMPVLSKMHIYVMIGSFWMFAEDIFPAVGFLGGGVVLLLFGRSMTNRLRRFSKYLAVAGNRPCVEIRRLADVAEVKTNCVENDLETMIDKGLWGREAYLDLGAGKLYRSAKAAWDEEEARQAEEKKRKAEEESTPPEADEGYAGMLRQIRRVNDRISDESLSAKIDRLEELTGRIFRLVEKEPEKKAAASTFLNYYLPTTQKLLDSYAEFEEAGVSGKNLNEAKARIERIMDTIVQGFERQLDELYRADTMDIESDIRVMEAMLRRDSASAENDFGLGSND